MLSHRFSSLRDRITVWGCPSDRRAVCRCFAASILPRFVGRPCSENTDFFIRDLRERALGTPKISTDGFPPYKPAIRDAFGPRVALGVINKTYAVTDLGREAARRDSPAAVVKVER
jgi:hypothetical protein